MKCYSVGLAVTLHDPALAIVDPSGTPVFAEATERYLQCKRAFNCTPDDLIRIPRLIEQYCEPDAEIVAALSWSSAFFAQLEATRPERFSSMMEIPGVDEHSWPLPGPPALMTGLRNSIAQAAVNLASSREITNAVTIRRYDHHWTHAATAAYTSPFEEAVVAVVDGYGEAGSTAFFHYESGHVAPIREGRGGSAEATGSLGQFYSRLCGLCGFDPLKGEEWKVMGLASYGKTDERLYDLLRPMISVKGLSLHQGCSDADLSWRVRALRELARGPDSSPLESADLACTGQRIFEEIMAELLTNLFATGLSKNLAFAGGSALNCAWNGRILERTPFERLHVPAAPADDGNALGAAMLAWRENHPGASLDRRDVLTPYLGSTLSEETLQRLLLHAPFSVAHLSGELCRRTARLLADGKLVGWVQGRAEFGPRALGNRSILADPRPAGMQDRINAEVKFREEFRPFAPAILDEHGPDYFEDYQTSPYMDRTLRFRPEMAARVPAVVHVDGTGRLQSVRREWNPRFHELVCAFRELTDVPLLLNTSFNVMGKPIIHSVEDALGVFATTGLDALVLNDYLIEKQPAV